jgi:hypothetical protein
MVCLLLCGKPEEGVAVSQKAETNRRSFDYWRQADVILPTQDHARTRVLDDPEHRLRFAVLEDAVHQFQRYVNAVGRRERALYEDVLDWFASENRSEPFSFESVCDALHIDPDFVRSRLRRWRDGAQTRVSRSPRRVVTGRRTMSLRDRVYKGSRASGVRTPALLVDSSA